jgi:rod shape-determining protein MreD
MIKFFLYTLFLSLTIPLFFPSLRLLFFAPFLVFCFYHHSKKTCLWLAFLCGLFVDLLSSYMRLGIYALNYCLTVQLLYSQKRHFFQDSRSTLPILTYLFALLSTCLHASLLYSFGKEVGLSWEWIKTDLLGMPIRDAIYTTIAFTFPSMLFNQVSKRSIVIS